MNVSGLGSTKSYIQHSKRSEVKKDFSKTTSVDSKLDVLIKNSKGYLADSYSEPDIKTQVYSCFDSLDSIVDGMDGSKIKDKDAVKTFLKDTIFVEVPHPSGKGVSRGIKNSELNAAKKMIDVLNDSGQKVKVSWSDFLKESYIPKVAERASNGESCNISLQEILADYKEATEKKSADNSTLNTYLSKTMSDPDIKSFQLHKKHSNVDTFNSSELPSNSDLLNQKLNTAIDTIDSFFDKDTLKSADLSKGEKSQLLTKVGQLVKELKPDSSGALKHSFSENFVQQQRINKLEAVFKSNIADTVKEQFEDFEFVINSTNDFDAELLLRTLNLQSIEDNIALMEADEAEQKKLEEKLTSLKEFNDQINEFALDMETKVQDNAKGSISYDKHTITAQVKALPLDNPSLKDNAIAYLNKKFDDAQVQLGHLDVADVVAAEEPKPTEIINFDEMLDQFEELLQETGEFTAEQIDFIDRFISEGILETSKSEQLLGLLTLNFYATYDSLYEAPRNMDQLNQNKEKQKSFNKVSLVASKIIAKQPNIADSESFSLMANFAVKFSQSSTQIEQQLKGHTTLFEEGKDSELCLQEKTLPILAFDGSLSKSHFYPTDLQYKSLQRFEDSLKHSLAEEGLIRLEVGSFQEKLGLCDPLIAQLNDSLTEVGAFFSDSKTTELQSKLISNIDKLTALKGNYLTAILQNKWDAAQQDIRQADSFDDLLAVHSKYSSDTEIIITDNVNQRLNELCDIESKKFQGLTQGPKLGGDVLANIDIAKKFFNDKSIELDKSRIASCSDFDSLKSASNQINLIDGNYDETVIAARDMKFNDLLTQRASELDLSSLDELNANLYPDAGSSISFDDQCDIAKDFFAKIEADQIEAEQIKEQDAKNNAATTIQAMVRGGFAKQLVEQMKTDINASLNPVSVDSAYEYKKFSDCTSLEELKEASFGPDGADRPITAGNSKSFNSKVMELCKDKILKVTVRSILSTTSMSYAQKCESLQKIIGAGGVVNQKAVSALDSSLFSSTTKAPDPQLDLKSFARLDHPQSFSSTVSMNFLDRTEDLSDLSDRQIQKLQYLDNELADNFHTRTHIGGLSDFEFSSKVTIANRNDSLSSFLRGYDRPDLIVIVTKNDKAKIKYQSLQMKMIENAYSQPKSRITPQRTRNPAVPKTSTSKASSSLASRPAWNVSARGGDPNSGSKSLGDAVRYNRTKSGYGR